MSSLHAPVLEMLSGRRCSTPRGSEDEEDVREEEVRRGFLFILIFHLCQWIPLKATLAL